jgi:DNA polymerase-1
MISPSGCVHPDFLVYGTEVGRLSARDPAIQTIPRATSSEVAGVQWGKMVRDLFVARPEYVWVKVDYSQAELRVAAALSGDEFLLDVFQHGRDLHSEVARAMYGDNYTYEQRMDCKMFNFSYLYGGSEHSFAADAGLPLSVAKAFVRQYNNVMKGLAAWKLEQLQKMKEQGYVETVTGRRRRIPLITHMNLEDARKSSVHAPVAGAASDLTLQSFIEVHNWGLDGVRALIAVHDEIDIEVHKDRVKDVVPKVIRMMEEIASSAFPQVPWKADAEVGPSWGSIAKMHSN